MVQISIDVTRHEFMTVIGVLVSLTLHARVMKSADDRLVVSIWHETVMIGTNGNGCTRTISNDNKRSLLEEMRFKWVWIG